MTAAVSNLRLQLVSAVMHMSFETLKKLDSFLDELSNEHMIIEQMFDEERDGDAEPPEICGPVYDSEHFDEFLRDMGESEEFIEEFMRKNP